MIYIHLSFFFFSVFQLICLKLDLYFIVVLLYNVCKCFFVYYVLLLSSSNFLVRYWNFVFVSLIFLANFCLPFFVQYVVPFCARLSFYLRQFGNCLSQILLFFYFYVLVCLIYFVLVCLFFMLALITFVFVSVFMCVFVCIRVHVCLCLCS